MLADVAYALGAVVLLAEMIGPPDGAVAAPAVLAALPVPLWTKALAAGAWFIVCELCARGLQTAIRRALDR